MGSSSCVDGLLQLTRGDELPGPVTVTDVLWLINCLVSGCLAKVTSAEAARQEAVEVSFEL